MTANQEIIKSFLQEVGQEALKAGKDYVIAKAKELFANDFELFKILWNYEEKNVQFYSFDNAVSWLKTNYNIQSKFKGGIYYQPENEHGITVLHIFFLRETMPLLSGNAPHLVINTLALDGKLQSMFSNTNLYLIE